MYPAADNWLRKDVWYDLVTREYYTCSDICFSQPVDLCGDGYESNGPYDQWDTALYPDKDTREECDDGNNVDGDGCSHDCKVENEWECMDDPGNDLWGLNSCRPKCGNGIVEASYRNTADDGEFIEECDLGYTFNTDDDEVYDHACSSDCKKRGTTVGVDYHLWRCDTTGTDRNAISTCYFLCGNNYLDTDEFEPCDRLVQPYSAQTAAEEYVDLDADWDTDPLSNVELNIGCSKTCLIEDNFICPETNDYVNADGRNPLLCTDRCHDGEFDGPYP